MPSNISRPDTSNCSSVRQPALPAPSINQPKDPALDCTSDRLESHPPSLPARVTCSAETQFAGVREPGPNDRGLDAPEILVRIEAGEFRIGSSKDQLACFTKFESLYSEIGAQMGADIAVALATAMMRHDDKDDAKLAFETAALSAAPQTLERCLLAIARERDTQMSLWASGRLPAVGAVAALAQEIARNMQDPRLSDMHAQALSSLGIACTNHVLLDTTWIFPSELCKAAFFEIEGVTRQSFFCDSAQAKLVSMSCQTAVDACFAPWFDWMDGLLAAVHDNDLRMAGDSDWRPWIKRSEIAGRRDYDRSGVNWHVDGFGLVAFTTLYGPTTSFIPDSSETKTPFWKAGFSPDSFNSTARGQTIIFNGTRRGYNFPALVHRAPTWQPGERLSLRSWCVRDGVL